MEIFTGIGIASPKGSEYFKAKFAFQIAIWLASFGRKLHGLLKGNFVFDEEHKKPRNVRSSGSQPLKGWLHSS